MRNLWRDQAIDNIVTVMEYVAEHLAPVRFRWDEPNECGISHRRELTIQEAAEFEFSTGRATLQVSVRGENLWQSWRTVAPKLVKAAIVADRKSQQEKEQHMVKFEETGENAVEVESRDERAAAVEALRQDLRKKANLPSGTIIRWTSVSFTGQRYEYAAIYVNRQFYTTLQRDNSQLKTTMSYDDMLEYLSQDDRIQNVMIATEFEAL